MNSMGAFFSSTDNSDDKHQITMSGVLGKLNTKTPESVWRLNLQGEEMRLKIEDIFSMEPEAVKVPEEWLKQVSRNASQYTGTHYNGTYSGSATTPGSGSGNYGGYSGNRSVYGTSEKDFDKILSKALDVVYRPIPGVMPKEEAPVSPKTIAVGTNPSLNSTATNSGSQSAAAAGNQVVTLNEIETANEARDLALECCAMVHEGIELASMADPDIVKIMKG